MQRCSSASVPVSRMGGSFMTEAGLTDWGVTDDDDYVAIAIAKGQNRQSLLDLKKNLRERLKSCPAWDVAKHTRAMEAAWQQAVQPTC